MEARNEKVQILLSAYNGEKFIRQQLDSLIEQTHQNISILVRDDGSSDGTRNILDEYKKNGLIDYYSDKNLGVVSSFLDLVRKADPACDYYAFCDQDDYWEPEKIARAVGMLSGHKVELPLVYGSQIKIVDQDLKLLRSSHDKRIKKTGFGNAMLENVITGCTAVFNQAMREALLCVKNERGIFMHDWLLYLIGSSMGKVIYDQEPTLHYRQHNLNVLGAGTSPAKTIKRKFSLLIQYIKTDLIYDNNAAFYTNFSHLLPDKEKALLERYLKKEKSIKERISLAFLSGLFRQRKFDNVVFKFFLVTGRI